MSLLPGNRRFFASTRGRIITLLRRSQSTVEELAQKLGLTDNAIRAHLAALERDGVVQQDGVRRNGGKPSSLYDLTAEAEQLFPKAYEPVLKQLLTLLSERMPPEEVEELLREAGRRIASARNAPQGTLPERLATAIEVLNELGGMAELAIDAGRYRIVGYSCPLAAIVPGHPAVCSLAETLLSALIGVPVQEHCNKTENARCCFAVGEV